MTGKLKPIAFALAAAFAEAAPAMVKQVMA